MAYPMGEAKQESLRVDCDRSLEFSSRGVLQRPVNFSLAPVNSDSSGPSCRRVGIGFYLHDVNVGPHVIRGISD